MGMAGGKANSGHLPGRRPAVSLISRAVDRLPVQFAQVVDGGVELPLTAAMLQTAHAEVVGALPLLHLSEHRFDRNPALAVKGAAALGTQLAVHTLTRGHGPPHPPPRCRRIAQRGPLPMVLLGGDEQLAFLGLAVRIGLRPIPSVTCTPPSNWPKACPSLIRKRDVPQVARPIAPTTAPTLVAVPLVTVWRIEPICSA